MSTIDRAGLTAVPWESHPPPPPGGPLTNCHFYRLNIEKTFTNDKVRVGLHVMFSLNDRHIPIPHPSWSAKGFGEVTNNSSMAYGFLPRCMECRRGLAMRFLSVRLSNACIVTKRKKNLSRLLYRAKDHSV